MNEHENPVAYMLGSIVGTFCKSVVAIIGIGLIGWAMGWVVEFITLGWVYWFLDVIPNTDFSKGDFPKLFAIASVLGMLLKGRSRQE